LIAAVLIVVARPIAVLISASYFKFSPRELVFLSLVGLKGAVPITLATFPMLAGLPGASQVFDTVFFVVLVSALIQGWPLPLAARYLKVDEPTKQPPPVTLEISSLQSVDGDIVDYLVDACCLAAGRMVKDLALPDGVVVALIVRGDEFIPPQGRSRIEVGDHVVVVLRPAVRAMVDRVFAHCGQDEVQLPTALEFPLRGSIKVRDIEEFYDVKLHADHEATLDELMRAKLDDENVTLGAAVPFDEIVLYVREVTADGTIEYVGMKILPAEDTQRTESPTLEEAGARLSNDPPENATEDHTAGTQTTHDSLEERQLSQSTPAAEVVSKRSSSSIEINSKLWKLAELSGALLLIFGFFLALIAASRGAYSVVGLMVFVAIAGAIVYLGARFRSWWNQP
jgi:cell volume regulation protein A